MNLLFQKMLRLIGLELVDVLVFEWETGKLVSCERHLRSINDPEKQIVVRKEKV